MFQAKRHIYRWGNSFARNPFTKSVFGAKYSGKIIAKIIINVNKLKNEKAINLSNNTYIVIFLIKNVITTPF